MQMPSEGALCHVEIAVNDVAKAKAFYSECFGWSFTDIPNLNYHIYQTGEGGIGGGLMQRPEGFPSHMVNYINCADVDAAAQRVENNGGKIVQPKQEVPQTGWYILVTDPEENLFGLWQGMGQQQ